MRLLLAALVFALPSTAHAANVLFVADATNDTNIATALMADGHTVTSRTNDLDFSGVNASFTSAATLAEYDVVFWSVSGGAGFHGPATYSVLTEYVMAGGRVLVTGYDGTLGDSALPGFLGASSSSDQVGVPPGAIASVDTTLTNGVVDIRGLTPTGGYPDKDCIRGLSADTILLVASGGDTSCAQWSIRTVGDGEVVWLSNGSYFGTDPSWELRSTDGTGAYNGAIRNFAAAADSASTVPGAPTIAFDRTYSAEEGAEITLTVTVSDPEGDPFTFSWDTDDDGTFGELPGMTTFTVAAGTTDGDASMRISVEASDGSHTSSRRRTIHVTNVAPRVTSTPPVLVSVGENLRYLLEVEDPAGALDPLAFAVARGPSSAAVNADGTFVWMPTELDVTLGTETVAIEVEVDDGDGGTTIHAWEMMVSPNHPPEGMMMLYPTAGIGLLEAQPRLVVSDGVDQDVEDTLTYFFELDSDVEFADPILFESGPVAQTPGYTAFVVPSPLAPGLYHWRAWMSDGFAQTAPLTASFFVLPDPDADAGPLPDGGTIGTDSGTVVPPMGPRGCGCSAPGSSRGTPIAIALMLGLAIALRRRR